MSNSNQFQRIERAFQSGMREFLAQDKEILKKEIADPHSINSCASAIYIYSYLYDRDVEVISICRKYTVGAMEPGLSAACYKALFRSWSLYDDDCIESIRKFLNPELWDSFYDEIFFLVRFLIKGDGLVFNKIFAEELSLLLEWAKSNKENDLLDAWK